MLESNFFSFILFIKLKCNKDHIHGMNWALINKVKMLKLEVWSLVTK